MARSQDKIKERDYYARFAASLDNLFIKEDYKRIFSLMEIDSLKNLYILDAGCGKGVFGKELALMGHRVVGIDLSPHLVEIANEEKRDNFRAMVGDLEERDTFEAGTFDAVFFSGLLHHLPDMNKVISNTCYWLKEDGKVFILEPNGSNPVNSLVKKIVNVFLRGEKYRTYVGTPNEKIYSYRDFEKILEKQGFKNISFKPFVFYYPKRLLKNVGSKTVKFLLILRNVFYRLAVLSLPPKYKSSQIIIVARKK